MRMHWKKTLKIQLLLLICNSLLPLNNLVIRDPFYELFLLEWTNVSTDNEKLVKRANLSVRNV